MNAGIIASRYARAFLKYVLENGAGEHVYSQSCILMAYMKEHPQLEEYLLNPSDVSLERKVTLMVTVFGQDPDQSIVRLLTLVTDHHRLEYFPRMLLSFIEQYRKEKGIMVGKLVTASYSDGLRERLEEIFHDRTGAQVHLEEKVDGDILGGFIFELEGYRVDASVDGQLQRIRRQLIEKTNRIV